MAGLRFFITTDPITLSSSADADHQTLLQVIAPSSQRVLIKKATISFNGVTPADPPVRIDFVRQSTGGTMTGSVTPTKAVSSDTETIQTTAGYGSTAAPSDVANSRTESEYIHQQDGDRITYQLGKEIPVVGGTRLGIKVVPGTVTGTVKCVISLECEE